jgi:protoporphyrinogen oxidase
MNGAIRYRIVVTALVEREEKVGKDWAVISQEVKEGTDKVVNVTGYTPEILKTLQKDVMVYEQCVENLDMAALVKVVNGITS